MFAVFAHTHRSTHSTHTHTRTHTHSAAHTHTHTRRTHAAHTHTHRSATSDIMAFAFPFFHLWRGQTAWEESQRSRPGKVWFHKEIFKVIPALGSCSGTTNSFRILHTILLPLDSTLPLSSNAMPCRDSHRGDKALGKYA